MNGTTVRDFVIGVGALALVTTAVLPGRNTAAVLSAIGGASGYRRCWKTIHWPVTNYGWTIATCPLSVNHLGLHADENWVPFFTDEDAEWFNEQYRITYSVDAGFIAGTILH